MATCRVFIEQDEFGRWGLYEHGYGYSHRKVPESPQDGFHGVQTEAEIRDWLTSQAHRSGGVEFVVTDHVGGCCTLGGFGLERSSTPEDYSERVGPGLYRRHPLGQVHPSQG